MMKDPNAIDPMWYLQRIILPLILPWSRYGCRCQCLWTWFFNEEAMYPPYDSPDSRSDRTPHGRLVSETDISKLEYWHSILLNLFIKGMRWWSQAYLLKYQVAMALAMTKSWHATMKAEIHKNPKIWYHRTYYKNQNTSWALYQTHHFKYSN